MSNVPSLMERRWAAAMHMASVVAPFLSPILGLALFRNSAYIRAHSAKALTEALALKVAFVIGVTCSVAFTTWQLWNLYLNDWQGWDWSAFLLRLLLGWLIVTILGFLTAIQSFVAAFRAHSGEWTKGRIARSMAATT